MGAAINSLLLPCWGGKGQESVSVRNGEETVATELYIDGSDICCRQRFEFAKPHCCQSLSEDSVINIVGGTHALMNTKVLFTFSGGFPPKLIRKICTLHLYEFENSALLKLSQCFSLTQHIRKYAKLKVKIFKLGIHPFVKLMIYFLHSFDQSILISGLSKTTILQRMMIWKWQSEFEFLFFLNIV